MRETRRLVVALLAMTLVGAVLAPAALAAEDSSNVTVSSGSLEMDTLDSITDFGTVTLSSSTAETTTATMQDFNVRDFRGSGDGWSVSAQATQFKEYLNGSYTGSGITLPTSSLDLSQPTVSQVNDTTSPPPTITGSIPYTIDSGSAVSFASAAEGDGMGEYSFAFGGTGSLTLTVPVEAEATTYRSNLTISLNTGP